jgi:regulator of protease activity HflC (stomatin/prohibitin superfamily)
MPFLIIILVLGLFILFASFFTVKQQTVVYCRTFWKISQAFETRDYN